MMVAASSHVYASSEEVKSVKINRTTADKALIDLSSQFNKLVLFPADVAKYVVINNLSGDHTLQVALDLLLSGTGLIAYVTEDGVIAVRAIPELVKQVREGKVKYFGNLNNFKIKRNLFTTASMIAVSVGAANAQQADDVTASSVTLEEIVVTGMRSSLKRSLDAKRDASGVMDSIASEDLGKFPDSNIAEALQRIPGITIDRNGGEGQFVTVRGFGPSFNTVLINGRRMSSEVGGRKFSFDLFPSELISGADIYKTGVATLQEGGIGSTINLKTARPLGFSGFKAIFSAKGLYDNNRDTTSPQVFGLVSNTFADDTIGVLISASYQERKSQVDTYNNRGIISAEVSSLDPAVNIVNPGNADRLFMFQNLQEGRTMQKRERTNIQAVVQYQAQDNILITVDGMWNEFDVNSQSRFLNTWFSLGDLDNIVLDDNGTVLRADHNFNGAIEARAQNDTRRTRTRFGGFNVKWDQSDEFEHQFDFSYSDSENKPKGSDTGQSVLGFRSTFTLINDGSTTLPISQLTDVTKEDILDTGRFLAHIAQFGGDGDSPENANSVDDDIFEIKYDGVYRPEDGGFLRSISYGINYAKERKTVQILRTDQDVLCFYCGFFVDVGDAGEQSLLELRNLAGFIDAGDGGFIDKNGAFIDTFLTNTVAGDIAYFSTPEALAKRDIGLGLAPGTSAAEFAEKGGFATQVRAQGFKINEKILAAYVSIDLEGETSDMPWAINAGLRWVKTKTTATGTETPLLDIVKNPFDTTEFFRKIGDIADATITNSNEYNKLLPNFNFKLELKDGLIFRLAASQTLTRPDLADLAPKFTILNTRPNQLIASGGNTGLKPFTSTNLDASVEYYFGELNYIAVSGFWKEIEDFIVQTTSREIFIIENVDNIVDPSINGNEATFDVTRPSNAETARVKGVEIAGQYMFSSLPSPFDGLGVSGNVLFLSSNASFGPNSLDRTSFALPGLSDSQNAQIFYAKGPFEARISYSRREKFLEQLNNVIGGEPAFVEDFEQVDFQVSYKVIDNDEYGSATIFIEGTNIFNEKIGKVGRFDNQFLAITETGARYAAGFRYSF